MVAKIGPITDFTLERSTQLINKSNQFNLTTIRRTTAEVLAIAHEPQWVTRTVSLKDRFGDNGLIAVLLAKVVGDALEIDTWLMSCRVLKRNVEHTALNILCQVAIDRGLRVVRGKYIPTAKNALVKDHYTSLGFTQISGPAGGECVYELKLAGREPFATFIEVQEQP
jgi:FkbH-like protein